MLIFLDLETTGLGSSDRICSIGLCAVEGEKTLEIYELVNEGKKISSKASSINNITNEMIKIKPALKQTRAWSFLQESNNENTTLIAHNVNFDLKMLEYSGFEWRGKVIDTLRSTKHLISECEYFSLQFLRYELKLYKKENAAIAHNALSDALLVKLLYEYLLDLANHEDLIELTKKNALVEKLNFGKYKERYIEDISMCDRGYLEWILANIDDLDEDLKYSIKKYLNF
jgi:DNA polymerase-3 subunit epsilon/exodeoxyribonuclease X